ncbi:MAG: hypothetical protein U0798_01335 [Gemmataceae bacterium]
MAMNTFSMIPSVFSVSLKNVTGRIVRADKVSAFPAGHPSRGHDPMLRDSRLMRLHYSSRLMPDASWPRHESERGCQTTQLNQTTKQATKG